MTDEKEIILYHYTRGTKVLTTPNLQIALLRSEKNIIQVDTTVNGITSIVNLQFDNEE